MDFEKRKKKQKQKTVSTKRNYKQNKQQFYKLHDGRVLDGFAVL